MLYQAGNSLWGDDKQPAYANAAPAYQSSPDNPSIVQPSIVVSPPPSDEAYTRFVQQSQTLVDLLTAPTPEKRAAFFLTVPGAYQNNVSNSINDFNSIITQNKLVLSAPPSVKNYTVTDASAGGGTVEVTLPYRQGTTDKPVTLSINYVLGSGDNQDNAVNDKGGVDGTPAPLVLPKDNTKKTAVDTPKIISFDTLPQ